jgi:23S rRNA-/tRNA-specific pseudouridylate synthase
VPAGASELLIETLRGFKRQALHAAKLGLKHPRTQAITNVTKMHTDLMCSSCFKTSLYTSKIFKAFFYIVQLANKTVYRVYDLVVYGNIIAGGTIDEPIKRHPVDPRLLATTSKPLVSLSIRCTKPARESSANFGKW